MLLDQLAEQEALTCKTERWGVSKWNQFCEQRAYKYFMNKSLLLKSILMNVQRDSLQTHDIQSLQDTF